jgi:hypothetical protein
MVLHGKRETVSSDGGIVSSLVSSASVGGGAAQQLQLAGSGVAESPHFQTFASGA